MWVPTSSTRLWAAVRGAGNAFAYIKATEGIGSVSSTLDAQLAGARGAGLVTGLYHYGRPDTNSPQQDAADFAGQLARLNASGPGNLPPCLDLEVEGGDLAAWTKGFIDAIRGHTGRNEVVVYASGSWLGGKLGTDSWVDPGVMLWVAHYGRPPGEPGYRTDRVVLHQYDNKGQVAGIAAPTDLNMSLVDMPVLTGGPPPGQAPPPGRAPAPQPPPGQVPPPGRAPAPQPPPAQPPPPLAGSYVVQPGDTLLEISQQRGVDQAEVARVNGITDPDLIYVGQVLRLPG